MSTSPKIMANGSKPATGSAQEKDKENGVTQSNLSNATDRQLEALPKLKGA